MLKLNQGKLALSISFFLITAPLSTASAVSDEVAVQLLERLGELEKEISHLRGENQMLRQGLSDIRNSQRRGFLEVDERFTGLEKKGTGVTQETASRQTNANSNALESTVTAGESTQTVAAAIVVATPQGASGATLNNAAATQTAPQLPNEATAVQRQAIAPTESQGTIVAKEVTANNNNSYYYYGDQDKNDPVAGVNASKTSLQAQQSKTIPDTHKAKAAYNEAYKLLVNNPKSAVPAFRSFMIDHPEHKLVANAQYWLGEALYAQKDYSGATEEFMKVLKDHKGSPKAPGAALKLGYSFYELRQWDFARRTLEDTVRFFPNTNAATLAKSRLERMQAEGK